MLKHGLFKNGVYVGHVQVVVRLGRQRWKIRGRIESDDSQSWDEEEMVFLPHIYHNFEIKVGGDAKDKDKRSTCLFLSAVYFDKVYNLFFYLFYFSLFFFFFKGKL